jgi:hypothetical protein
MSNDAQFLRVAPGTVADTGTHPIVRASSIYGGFTVTAAYVVAGGAGTANAILMNYGTSAGTSTNLGTVAAFSGTTVFTAGAPQALTVTTANQFIDDGEWLVLKMDGALPANSVIMIETVAGATTTG